MRLNCRAKVTCEILLVNWCGERDLNPRTPMGQAPEAYADLFALRL